MRSNLSHSSCISRELSSGPPKLSRCVKEERESELCDLLGGCQKSILHDYKRDILILVVVVNVCKLETMEEKSFSRLVGYLQVLWEISENI